MIPIRILDETAPLEAVVLGTAESMGGVPDVEHTYDPKSREHVIQGTFTKEQDAEKEMQALLDVFARYQVQVFRPSNLQDLNQIFARDVGIVVGDKMIVPRIFEDRLRETQGITHILDEIDQVIRPNSSARMEGGDVMPWKGKIFVGYSKAEDFDKYKVARTNEEGVDFLRRTFPDWEVCAFELKKSDTEPRDNALHLDCCFQPVGNNKAIIYPGGFKHAEDVDFLFEFFGRENVFEITRQEMYEMNSNVFSIAPDVVVSEVSFHRLNAQLEDWGMTVERVPYAEISKMEGLFRCSTLPLRRSYV